MQGSGLIKIVMRSIKDANFAEFVIPMLDGKVEINALSPSWSWISFIISLLVLANPAIKTKRRTTVGSPTTTPPNKKGDATR